MEGTAENKPKLWTILLPSDEELQGNPASPVPPDLQLRLAAIYRQAKLGIDGGNVIEPMWRPIRERILAAVKNYESFISVWSEMKETLGFVKDLFEPMLPDAGELARVLSKCHIHSNIFENWLQPQAVRQYARGCLEMRTVTEYLWDNAGYFMRVRRELMRIEREDLCY